VIYSDPRINGPIPWWMASISGSFTLEEARQLAVVLRAGALPAPIKSSGRKNSRANAPGKNQYFLA